MKKKLTFIVALTATLSLNAFATAPSWEKVVITKNPEDVKGFTRIDDVSAETSRLYGKQSRLREETTIKIKQAAAKLGADIVLITVDNFAMSPINNVNMVGTAYASVDAMPKSKIEEQKQDSINSEETDWTKVIITKNTEDIKGLQRIDDISAETSRLYGNQSRLREETTIKIKQAAAKLGARIVLITVDDFAMSPINNVNMVGTAYK
jgi:ribosomal protein L21